MKLLLTALGFSGTLSIGLFITTAAFAQTTYVQVGEAKQKKSVVALTNASIGNPAWIANVEKVQKTIREDLEFMNQFQLLPAGSFPQSAIPTFADVKFPEWAKSGTDYVTFGTFKLENGQSIYEFHLTRVGDSKELLAKRYSAENDELKIMGHSIANDVVQALTGKKGIFLTKIAMVCDKSGKKEIYTMGFDGSEARILTRLRSLSMAPSWSPDGTRLVYSTYNRHSNNTKNIDLIEFNFQNGKTKVISNRVGINSGAAFSPDGAEIAYTMSHTGNPEIHILNRESGETRQLTRSVGFDVDPSFSPDGKQIAFVSSRPGKPMIYVMPKDRPKDAKRLTYAGVYNATPRWSPDGKKIVFAGWIEKRFDLFTITSDGAKIERLTKNEGNNEDPFYSPDGNFIVFSSNRAESKNVYVMSAEGGGVRRLTFGLGNCVAPQWSPYLN